MKNLLLLTIFLLIGLFIASPSQAESGGFLSGVWEFFEWVYDIAANIKDAVDSFLTRIAAHLVIWWFKLKLFTLEFTWSVVKPLVESLNITSTIQQYASQLDSSLAWLLSVNNLPEAINMIISAFVTRQVLDLIGW